MRTTKEEINKLTTRRKQENLFRSVAWIYSHMVSAAYKEQFSIDISLTLQEYNVALPFLKEDGYNIQCIGPDGNNSYLFKISWK